MPGPFRIYRPEEQDGTEYFPHCFILMWIRGRSQEQKRALMLEVADWCETQFGRRARWIHPAMAEYRGQTWDPNPTWFRTNMGFRFRNENDAFAFRLRWC